MNVKYVLLAVLLALACCGGAIAIDGGGTAVISFDDMSGQEIEVRCGAVGTWTITYTVPEGGMAVGGGIKVFREPNKYWLGQCKQTEDPNAPDYLTATRSDRGPIEFTHVGRFYKDHTEAQVKIGSKPMAAGSKITLVFGDISGGSMGAIVPFSWQPPAVFHIESDLDGNGKSKRISKPLVVRPVAGAVAKLVINMPMAAAVGEKVTLRIRAEDMSSNLANRFTGEVFLSCTDPKAGIPEKIRFARKDGGVKSMSLTFRTPGIHYVSARAAFIAAHGCSNPARITGSQPHYRVFCGDLHCHTEESDGTGSLDFNYKYARDVSWLDFMAVADHLGWDNQKRAEPSTDGPIHRTLSKWNDLQSSAARRYYAPGRFVTFLGYEWSGDTDAGGDHNAYYIDDRARVTCCADLNDEYKDLRSRGNRAAFIIPHVGGRTASPKWSDPVVEPSVEMASMHGHFEWMAQAYLSNGYKVGFNGGSDGHFGLPGNDTWPNHGRLGLDRRDTSVPQGLLCVIAPELTREAVRDAIFDRRTYATTNARILLDVTMDGRRMGEEYSLRRAPQMHILAAGTDEIGRIEIVRNAERIFNRKCDSKVVELDFKDNEPVKGTSYYYVRVSQSDGEIAWSSPIFFTYAGPTVEPKRESVPWNYESEEDELGGPVDRAYLHDLQAHLAWRAPGRFYDLRQVRMVRSPRGDYALFYGMDRKTGGRIHIRWYVGFESPRMHASVGWRDFGSVRR